MPWLSSIEVNGLIFVEYEYCWKEKERKKKKKNSERTKNMKCEEEIH